MESKMEIAWWRCVALFGIGLETWASSQPGTKVGIPVPWDKAVHGSAYAALAFTLCLGAGRFRRSALWLVPLIIALYAGADEWHQHFTPGRSCDPMDWLADMTGTCLSVLGWWRARSQEGRSLD